MKPFNSTAICTSVHPHVCGEHPKRRDKDVELFGSSPRVWGTCPREARADVARRFIPTCVGNIGLAVYPALRNAVHPHVCGEHSFHISY